jgi:hypothetical protein
MGSAAPCFNYFWAIQIRRIFLKVLTAALSRVTFLARGQAAM